VEEDLGADVARDVARILVVFLRRTGNQAQFSAQLETQVADRRPVRELQQYSPTIPMPTYRWPPWPGGST